MCAGANGSEFAFQGRNTDRNVPLKNYCTGMLLPGERKSVEPMAARLAPDNVQRMHQSLHHVVADGPWSDEAVLDQCLDFVLPAMLRQDPVVHRALQLSEPEKWGDQNH
jgi:SRSO17 transposase